MTKYKLTPAGKAYQAAANDKDKPHKGIILTRDPETKREVQVDIKDLKDGDPELSKISRTPYVEEDKKGT